MILLPFSLRKELPGVPTTMCIYTREVRLPSAIRKRWIFHTTVTLKSALQITLIPPSLFYTRNSLLLPSSICYYTHKLIPSAYPVNTIISSFKNKNSGPLSPLPHSFAPLCITSQELSTYQHSLSNSSTLILSRTYSTPSHQWPPQG